MPEKKRGGKGAGSLVGQQQEKNHPLAQGGISKKGNYSTPIVLHSFTGSKHKSIKNELQWLADHYGLTDVHREDWITNLRSEFTELEFEQLKHVCIKAILRKSKHASSL
jgi:hypothetical protein